MKTKIITLVLAIIATLSVSAQGYRVQATSYDISDNLDLEAVSYLFGESQNLQEFEERLNDPRTQISNLDLNRDGYVDYLRVVEQYESGMHLVTIQAVLDHDIFQDVATIDVERRNGGGFYVQVIGHPYLYGPNYIIEPSFVRVPFIFAWFARPSYIVWHSPYYWGYYPTRYKHYRCVSPYRYHRHIHTHLDIHVHTYHYSNVRRNSHAVDVQRQVSRNDYGRRNPNSSFSSRNSNYTNKYDMTRSRTEYGKRSSPTKSASRVESQQRSATDSRSYKSDSGVRRTTTESSGDRRQKPVYESTSTKSKSDNTRYSRPSAEAKDREQPRGTRSYGTSAVDSGKQLKSSQSSGYKPSQSESRTRMSSGSTNARTSSRSGGQSVERQSKSENKSTSRSDKKPGATDSSRTERNGRR